MHKFYQFIKIVARYQALNHSRNETGLNEAEFIDHA
jgi:hypothetical protein